MTDRDKILEEIIERELDMFLAAPNQGGTADCQKRPELFRLMRNMAHCAHGDAFLASYLEDLRKAEQDGRNFMIEKYARMDDLIPPLSNSPLIDEIVNSECDFMEEATKINPEMIRNRPTGMFSVYLRSELETLSEKSLALYAREIAQAKQQGRNPVLERHVWLTQKMNEGHDK